MNINVTIGFTPEALKVLQGLNQLLQVSVENQSSESVENVQASQPAQPVHQTQPVQQVQQLPTQQVVPTAVPTAVPTTDPVVNQPTQQAASTPVQPSAVPTSEVTYTMDQLAVAATQLVDAGKREELLQLLSEFGVQALTALPTEMYGAFATKLRGLGAKI